MHLYASQVINAENYALRALRDLGYTHTRNGCEAVTLMPAPASTLSLVLSFALALALALTAVPHTHLDPTPLSPVTLP